MKRYTSFEELSKDCPGICKSIARENEAQFPHAKFVVAAVGQYGVGLDDEDQDLIVLFDVGLDEELLYVWGCGYLPDSVADSGTYIDEYDVMSDLEAHQQLDMVK